MNLNFYTEVFVLIFTQLAVKMYLPYVLNSLCIKHVSDLERCMDFLLFLEEVVKIRIFFIPAKQFLERLLNFSRAVKFKI